MRALPRCLLLAVAVATGACAHPPAKSVAEDAVPADPPGSHEDPPDPPSSPVATTEPPRPPASITVTPRAFLLGSKIESITSMGIEALFTAQGPHGQATVEDYGTVTDHRVVQLLGFEHGATRKIRVSFLDRSTTRIVNGRQRHIVSPVSGKAYVLEARDEGLAILDDRGRDVSHKEGETLAQLFHMLGTPEELSRAIPHAPMSLGHPVAALAEALKRDFQRGVEGRVWFGQVSVTPAGTREVAGVPCVVLGIVLQVGFETDGRKVQMDTKGELLLRSEDAWPVTLDLAGPVGIDLTEKGIPIHGQGKSRLTASYSYP